MFSKRNIAIFVGTLLALMSLCASNAAAEEVKLGISVSPENLVIGTFSKWVSVCFHAEDFNSNYAATDINYGTVTLQIKDKEGNIKTIGANEYDRFEYTDEDDDTYDELVLIYLASDLLDEEVLTLDGSQLTFTATGGLADGNTFTASCPAKTTLIKIPPDKGPGEHRPEDPGSGEEEEQDDDGHGKNGPGTGGPGKKGK